MPHETSAREIMSAPVTSLERGTSLEEAARILTERGFGGAPVVDRRGEPQGIVTLFDLVVYLSGLDRRPGRLGELFLASREKWSREHEDDDAADADDYALEASVEDVMTPHVVSVAPGTPLSAVARTLAVEGIHRVVVREGDGPALGIITSLDVLRAQQGVPRR
jgi:CBS domain-containing protein